MPRRPPEADLATLLARVEALENRVARLETGKPPPGDGRGVVAQGAGRVRRCSGCGLPLLRRRGRCAHCGVPL